jgi:hypothetical protein
MSRRSRWFEPLESSPREREVSFEEACERNGFAASLLHSPGLTCPRSPYRGGVTPHFAGSRNQRADFVRAEFIAGESAILFSRPSEEPADCLARFARVVDAEPICCGAGAARDYARRAADTALPRRDARRADADRCPSEALSGALAVPSGTPLASDPQAKAMETKLVL